MKGKFILFVLLSTCSMLFSQRIIHKDKDIHYVQLPMVVMPGVTTYNCVWNSDGVKETIPDIETAMGYNSQTVKGFLDIQGYTYSESDPDITVTLFSEPLLLNDPEIVNLSSDSDNPNYRALYSFPLNWKIEVNGKFSHAIQLAEKDIIAEVHIPLLKDQFGSPTAAIAEREIVEKFIDENKNKVSAFVKEQALAMFFANIKEVVDSELSYQKQVKEIKLSSFKSSKKADMSAWDAPYKKGLELLDKYGKGTSPMDLYNEYKDIFEFWDAQVEQHKDNVKENKKIIKVAIGNLMSLLQVVNPGEIKPEYLEVLDQITSIDELKTQIEDGQKRQLANASNTPDYGMLSKLPALDGYKYEMVYTNNKGAQVPGVIEFSSPYGFDPYKTAASFNLYERDTYVAKLGKVSGKDKIDVKDVQSYELFGRKFVKKKYTDPTAVSIGGTECFLEEMITGSASLYRIYPQLGAGGPGGVNIIAGGTGASKEEVENSRCHPEFVLKYKKKTLLVYNYSKLAVVLKDNQEVADKIKGGDYGNKPVAEKTSKLGKLMQQGVVNEISEEIIKKIVKEFNSLM
ncbi:hypothetical protein DMA11_08475 [Marinilabiliaceae bacterium JC017]|nr:hypothetical protein DMA11_08475 [Marinilabiliaceae bacterium JC017]